MSRDAWIAPQIQRLFESGSLSGLTEWQLLERFARNGDQAAFELLVSRYGPMVLGVCRRILDDAHDVDDAFQATFLVLIRRARTLGPSDVIAAWLHGVALKVARRARVRRERLLQRERTSLDLEAPAPASRDGEFELRAVLDQEIDRLPWKYQAPVALCYLQGLTHEETARQLGWPIGTVKGRLARARTLLGSRLSRRGITSAAGAVAGSFALDASLQAAPSESLVAAALRASMRIADGRPWDAVVSTSVADLVRGVFTAMLFSKLKIVAALVMLSGFAVTGAGVYGRQQAEDDKPDPGQPSPAVAAEETPKPESEPPQAKTAADRPVPVREAPEGEASAPRSTDLAHLRDEPEALRKQLTEAAEQAFQTTFDEYREKQVQPDRVYRASRLLLDARLDDATTPAARTAAYEAHYDRMGTLAGLQVRQRDGNIKRSTTLDEVRAFTAEAKFMLAKSRVEPASQPPTSNSASGGDEPEVSPRTVAILAKLEETIAMNFPNETPLEDILKYIKQATQGSDHVGIPIYVDPIGLSEAEKTMTSPISLDLDGVPLRRTLQLMLKQIGLVYFVDDGLLVITSSDSQDSKLGPSMVKMSPLLEKQMKAERGELTEDEMASLLAQLQSINQMKKLVDQKDSVHDVTTAPPGSSMTPEQVQTLLQQIKDLTAALNAANQRPKGGGFQ
ncbi:RNA polymerase sigma factor [Paludisphaera borealis]|uniref:ECF RNA polymerase sigma factor SigE n=1 Tax=Paludisphaera borealis TaxID=1387353 RepID=A0A1U7CM23_9BACT|nr:sigma-70 family RNA polymerase sigma factor [Paludisphaera borealis]APW59958.1 ECF RNA polymerase sigma factor SigE [Paludisphaera borealis]